MPEGHTLHRLARDHRRMFAGTVVAASSPQGRFAEGAALLDGHRLLRAEAYGKHLLHRYERGPILHVHLGLYGTFVAGGGAAAEPRGALRLRLTNDAWWADLRGPTACEIVTPADVEALLCRLGPDPLRPRADPQLAYQRIARRSTPIGVLLMDQQVIAGIGNVYRAELLFRHRLSPFRPGRAVAEPVFLALWHDLVALMRSGVRSGRIVTIRAEDRPGRGRLSRTESVYVYRRAGEACRVCGNTIRTEVLAGRNLFWCPHCQAL